MITAVADSQPTESPTYWFAILDRARERNDYEKAAEAIRQLRRHGVNVTFAPQSQGGAPCRT